MKIKKIKVQNFKAIGEDEVSFDGCSAIVTAGNNEGKTSILRGMVDRLQSEKPEMIVKEGKEKGYNIVEFTDGSKIEWNFTKKSERFAYITEDGIKQTSGVISTIGERYFGEKFDIDKFLNSTPKAQLKELKEISGIDISDIEERYKEAYDQRTEANRELKRVRSRKLDKPEKVDKPNVSSLKEELKSAREQNEKHRNKKAEFVELNQLKNDTENKLSDTLFEGLFDSQKASDILDNVEVPEKIVIDELEDQLDEANEKLRKYDSYERDLEEYEKWVKEGKKAKKEANKLDQKVKDIEQEKKEAIAKADFPEGFDIDGEELIYNGFPLSENQISTSAKYIAGMKLGSMVLGEVRTLHFDASNLDNESLSEVQEWAEKQDLQLLIERPDFDGGDIKYELINKKEKK